MAGEDQDFDDPYAGMSKRRIPGIDADSRDSRGRLAEICDGPFPGILQTAFDEHPVLTVVLSGLFVTSQTVQTIFGTAIRALYRTMRWVWIGHMDLISRQCDPHEDSITKQDRSAEETRSQEHERGGQREKADEGDQAAC
ncbi:hypothetical protein CAC42_7507 [Sphaceloma murrayae]|uniref:Uncharacterized protein n=1 Tax=Sphaceloma murrayae TaxID=2082308 RepID=A0A2K1QXM4_9PEZI|nr:hypothetical protein CAC42_7507 [Sphaceloma murrayae]